MTDEELRRAYEHGLARRAGAASDCPSPEALHALARREGPEEERLRTLDHVMACAAGCRGELDLLRAIERAGAESVDRGMTGAATGASTPAAARAQRAWSGRRWLVPVLAAASLVVAVGVGRGVTRRGDRDVAARDGVERGATGDAAVVRLVGPAEGATVDGEQTLAWRSVAGAGGYTVEVLDAGGALTAARHAADTTFVFHGAPGAYRWWVRADVDGGVVQSPFRALVVRAR